MKTKKNKKKKMTYKNILTSLAFFSLFLTSLVNPISAQAEEDSSDSASTIDNIKKVIQEKKTELGTVGANLRTQRAYLAKVLRVSEETLTVSNYAGNKIIPLEEDVLMQKSNKDIGVADIAVDNWVGVYGEIVDDNLKIKKIMVYEKDFSPKDKIISIGSISSLGKNDLKINPRSGGQELSLSFDKNTSFQDFAGEEVSVDDFYEDLQCLVVAFADKNGNYVISTIRSLSSLDK